MPIPAELRDYAQWVVWRFESPNGESKPTKVPYCPHTGCHASVTDPRTWGTYEQCMEVGEAGGFSGLGFVLTGQDPFSFLDLDKTRDPDAQQRQMTVFNEFVSYAETSPSGNGLHIIVKGHVPHGRKRSSIEVYSDRRFMTVTGCTFRDAPIADYHDLLNILWSQMAPPRSSGTPELDEPQVQDDAEIYDRAASAANGEKLRALYAGEWQNYYPSQSEGDFALVNILAFYTHNREQITRMFRASELGQRDKAQRDDYMGWMLNRAFDRILPPVDVDAIRQQIRAAIAEQKRPPPDPDPVTEGTPTDDAHSSGDGQDDPPTTPTRPPGLMGDIADYIYSASPRPVAPIALGAAIGLMAGICGRAYNVSATGLNMYTLILAGTGKGKEGAKIGIDKLMQSVTSLGDGGGGVPSARNFIGPAEISSPQALQKYLVKKSPSFVSIAGEIGLKIRQMTEPRAPSHMVGLRRAFLDLFSKSGKGQVMGSLIYSDADKSVDTITAPAFSLLGESAPERLFEYLDESMISEGLLPRFTVVEYKGKRPKLNKRHAHSMPDTSLVQRLGSLCGHATTLNQANDVVEVKVDDNAERMLDSFDTYCDSLMNSDDSKTVHCEFWNRAHLKSLKLAALVAVGINPYAPLITPDVAQWAINFVVSDVENMVAHFEAGDVGADNHETQQVRTLRRVATEYVLAPWDKVKSYGGSPALHGTGVIPHSVLSRRLISDTAFKRDRSGATQALKKAVQTLVDNGVMQIVGPKECQTFVDNGWMKSCYGKYYRLLEVKTREN